MKKIEDLFRAQAASPTETAGLFNGGVGFRIPDYQRPYDWSEHNIRRLFSDCLSGFHRLGSSASADAFTFLGTLILVKEVTKESSFGGQSVAIVDGQQRLTTLTLLACALVARLTNLREGIASLALSQQTRDWLALETDEWIGELTSCATGAQLLKANKTYPFSRIIRSGDQRGKSAAESEYRSAIGKFLSGFADYTSGDSTEFIVPPLGNSADAAKLAANYDFIRELVGHLSDADWYEGSECEMVPANWVERGPYRGLLERLCDAIGDEAAQNSAVTAVGACEAGHELLRTILFAAYFARCIVLTRVITDDESAAFDIFDALNTTGEPLTALETLKPRVIQFENSKMGYAGSASESAFLRLGEFIDERFRETSAKQGETKALVVSFGLFMSGAKLSENLAAQRTYLRSNYDQAAARSDADARRFVTSLADMAEMRHRYWSATGIEELATFHDASRVDEVQFLTSFLRATKTNLVLPILARYWRPDLKQAGDSDFLAVLRALTAFLVLRRAATGTTASIDSDFRAIMAPKTGPNRFGLCAGVGAPNAPLAVSALRDALRHLLIRANVHANERARWVDRVADNPLYSQSREIVRFMIFVAADRASPSADAPGCWTRDDQKISDHHNAFLTFGTWRSPLYETVEHVAPDSEKHSDWDQNIYKNAIMRHTLGNLCLLPKKENGAIGNGSWKRKQIFYRALTETSVSEQQKRVEEAAAQGMKFSESTKELLAAGQRLPLLDPLRDVEQWTSDIIKTRGQNIAGAVWDKLWPWLN